MYDYILRGGTVVDGTGRSPFRADVGIKDGKIVGIAAGLEGEARELIDVTGLAVAPGFIDFHSHSDTTFLLDDRCESKIFQGVTTEVAGQCGYTIYPCPEDRMENIRRYAGDAFAEFASNSFQEFMDKAQTKGKQMSTNLISLIGHGAIRCGVLGYEGSKATPEQLRQMQELLDRDMQAGAWGLSLGLGYTPGVFADQDELNALGEIVAKHDGIITCHMRDQGSNTPASLEELYEINLKTGAHVHVANFKAAGKKNWGRAPEFVQNVAEARALGIDVTVDIYPYTAASSDIITNCFPTWAVQGGKSMAIARLHGDERERIIGFLEDEYQTQSDGEGVYIVTTDGRYPAADGKNIWELSHELGLSMAETIAKVAVETGGDCTCIAFLMSDEDVDYMLAQENYVIGSDGSGLPLSPDENEGKPHPRNFGSFPRFLRWAREKGIALEKAVYRIAGLCAEFLHLNDRGILKPGMVADITVFDPVNTTDNATYIDPFRKPTGIEHVFISGQPALLYAKQTDKRLGRFILKK